MRIIDKIFFETSDDALNNWLSTRKKVQQLAKKDIMPLFTDTDYTNDKKWWWIALSLELLGQLATIDVIFVFLHVPWQQHLIF
jgi:hypothetical protein